MTGNLTGREFPGAVLLLTFLTLLFLVAPNAWSVPIREPVLPAPSDAAADLNSVMLRSGLDALATGDLEKASAAFSEVLKRDPSASQALLGMSELRLRQERPAEAANFLQRAIESDPDNPDVHVSAGRLHLSQGRYDEAEAAYLRAIETDHKSVLAHMGLGDLYLGARRQPERAVRAYRAAIEVAPGYGPGHYGLGMALVAAGDYAGAVESLGVAAELNQGDPVARHMRGRVLASLGRFDEAAEALSDALRIRPDFSPALYDRADVLAESGRDEEALRDFQRIVARNPADSTSRLKLAMIYHRLERFEEATTEYHQALRLNPNHAPAYNNLAMISLNSGGDVPQALEWAERAVSLAPNVPHFRATLGWALRAAGDGVGAVRELEAATRLDETQAVIWYRLGVSYQEVDRLNEAGEAFAKALAIDPDHSEALAAQAALVDGQAAR